MKRTQSKRIFTGLRISSEGLLLSAGLLAPMGAGVEPIRHGKSVRFLSSELLSYIIII
jgi:hypothetical protein